MANKLVLLVVLAVIAAAAALPVDKKQTPVVEDVQVKDKTTVEVPDKEKPVVTDDKDSSAESDEIADRHFYYPLYPSYASYVYPNYVYPNYVYPNYVYPGYVPSTVWIG